MFPTPDHDAPTSTMLEAWLAALLPDDFSPCSVSGVHRLSRGVSRETWMLDTVDVHRRARRLVMRRDLPGGSIDASPLRREYEIYLRLAASDIPVVPVLAYDDDIERCPQSRPAYLREHTEGTWMPEHFDNLDPAWDAHRVEICRSHIRALATVHATDWRALGLADVLPVPPDPRRSALAMIDLHERHLDDASMAPHPLVTLGIERLRRTAPASDRLCLLKGTNGLGEEVFLGDQLVAMSDWELAALGDPAYDFAQIQGFADRIERDGNVLWGPDHALDYYRELTGVRVGREVVRWYRRLYGLIMFAFAQRAARMLAVGPDRHARLAWVAIEMQHHGQRRLASLPHVPARDTEENR